MEKWGKKKKVLLFSVLAFRNLPSPKGRPKERVEVAAMGLTVTRSHLARLRFLLTRRHLVALGLN